MASLLELANVERAVEIRGVKIGVTGISARGLALLMTRFPEIGKMMSGANVDRDALIKLAPEALAAFIAAGTGKIGDEDAENVAANLGVGEQLDLIDEIMRLTFPRGVGPFVEKLQGLGLLAQVANPSPPTSPSQ